MVKIVVVVVLVGEIEFPQTKYEAIESIYERVDFILNGLFGCGCGSDVDDEGESSAIETALINSRVLSIEA